MGKRRVKQQNVLVIGLFKLAGQHKKMDDVFVYHECQSTSWSHSSKNKKHTDSITNNASHVSFTMFVYLFIIFFMCLSYTFCLAVRFNCIKVTRPSFLWGGTILL